MSETKLAEHIQEFEIEEEQGFECLEEDIFPEISEEEMQTEQEEEETGEERKISVIGEDEEELELDDKALAEINRSHDPSYTNVNFPYYLICEKRLTDRIKQVRMLLKSEVEKITAEQTSAFESVRIRRLYKTGMGLPERIFVEHDGNEKGTYKEKERLRYLIHNEIV